MAQTVRGLVQFLGFNSQGDIGELMVYTSKGGKLVYYPRAPPLTPASPEQSWNRNRFRVCGRMWQALTTRQKAAWEEVSKLAALRITGYNLFTCVQWYGPGAWFQTITRLAGFDPREVEA
jgi:hypothetical protein